MFKQEITFDRFIRGLIFIAVLALVLAAINYLSGVLIPFAVAWVVAYMLYPIVCFFQYKCRLRFRIVAIIVTLLLLCGVIAGLLYLAIPPMVDECIHLKDVALRYLEYVHLHSICRRGVERIGHSGQVVNARHGGQHN